jgi:RNA polymerase sigma factor (sigma-70 family)
MLTTVAASRTMTAVSGMPSQKEDADHRRAAWMIAAQAGDRIAYERLLRDCIPFIKLVVRRQGVHRDMIDDIVQETLVTVHRARQTYDPGRSFTAWLRAIAQRRVIDALRSGNRTKSREVFAPLAYENHSDPNDGPEDAAFQTEHTTLLKSAVDKLSAAQREAVEHLALQYQTLTQAAATTGRSTGSLRVNWHRALKSLRAQLAGKELTP